MGLSIRINFFVHLVKHQVTCRCTAEAWFLLSLTVCDSSCSVVYGVSVNLFLSMRWQAFVILRCCYLCPLRYKLRSCYSSRFYSKIFCFLDRGCWGQQKMLNRKNMCVITTVIKSFISRASIKLKKLLVSRLLCIFIISPKPVWRNVFVSFSSSGCRKGKILLSFLDTVLSDSPFPFCFYWNPFPFRSSSHI